jgi:hypothetical protein
VARGLTTSCMARQNRRPRMEMLGWCASVCKVRAYMDKRHGMVWEGERGGVDIERMFQMRGVCARLTRISWVEGRAENCI